MGVWMGDRLLGKRKSNPNGHFEDLDLLHFNDAILKAAGGTWRDPPTPEAIAAVTPEFTHMARQMMKIRDSAGHGLWGWKDPRTALTFPVYEPYLGDDAHLVVILRRPVNVARSLKSRNSIPIKNGVGLADAYNRQILTAAARHVGLEVTFR